MRYNHCYNVIEVIKHLSDDQNQELVCRALLELRPDASSFSLRYLKVFALTLALESVVYLPYLRRYMSWKQSFLWLLGLNLMTHPIVCHILPRVMQNQQSSSYLAVAESFAPIAEGLVLGLKTRSPLSAMLVAIAANLVSWNIGLILLS